MILSIMTAESPASDDRPAGRGWRRLLRVLAGWLLLAVIAPSAYGQVQRLAHATVVTETREGASTAAVTLPYHWDRHNPALSGRATFEIPFSLVAAGDRPLALFLPRVGNAYEVWINDVMVQRRGDLERPDGANYAKAPRLVEVPGRLLRADNVLRVRIRAESGRRGGLGLVRLGPAGEIEDLYDAAHAREALISLAVAILSLLVAATALALWLTQSAAPQGPMRRDPLYLSVFIAEVAWATRMGDILIDHPPLPGPYWSMLMAVALTTWVAGMMVFCASVAGWTRHPLGERATAWLWIIPALGLAASGLGVALDSSRPLSWFYAGLAVVVVLPFALWFCWTALRRGASGGHRLLALAAIVNTITGLHDTVFFRFSQGYDEQTFWLRYSAALFGLALGLHRHPALPCGHGLAARPAGEPGHAGGGSRPRAAAKLRAAGAARAPAGARGRAHPHPARHARRRRLAPQFGDPPVAVGPGGGRPGAADAARRAGPAQAVDRRDEPAGRRRDRRCWRACATGWSRASAPRTSAGVAGRRDRADAAAGFRRHAAAAVHGVRGPVQCAAACPCRGAAHRSDSRTPAARGCGSSTTGGDSMPRRAASRGLRSMHERAAAIGARLSVDSRPGRTVVEIELPTGLLTGHHGWLRRG